MKGNPCPFLPMGKGFCYNEKSLENRGGVERSMHFLKSWDKFDEKMRARATEELLRFMTLFSTAAAFVCFGGTLLNQGDMTLPFVLLTFWLVISVSWQYVKRKNERRWGVAKRTGKEVFRIGMTQPTAEQNENQQGQKKKNSGKSNTDKKKKK